MMDTTLLILYLGILPFMIVGCGYVVYHAYQSSKELRQMKREGNGND